MHTPAYFILWFTLCDFHAHNHITKALHINSTGCNKQIQWKKYFSTWPSVRSECQDYGWDNQDINVRFHSHLKDVSEAKASDECCKELKNRTEQSHGVLRKAQIIPLWYFHSDSEKRDSCTGTNVILVWKSIADRQLRKVDLYIVEVIDWLETEYRRKDQSVTFGAYDEYELFNNTLNAKYQQTQIPKIIYRVVRGSWNYDTYGAVIIIHNEPAYVPDRDKLCKGTVSGWDMITNNDPKSGLTYVCYLTEKLANKLSIGEYWLESLELDAIPYSEKPEWDATYPIKYYNVTDQVNHSFKIDSESMWENIGIES